MPRMRGVGAIARCLLLAVPGLSARTGWRGVDMSQIATELEKFPEDPFVTLSRSGVNAFRMRMWNDPCADHRAGCDPAVCKYSDLAGVLYIARRVKAVDMQFILDLHYSDWWADPAHQNKPHGWSQLPFPGLVEAVRNFTEATVAALVAQGTPPVAVQIGNEITAGMLWEGPSQGCELGGRLWCNATAPGHRPSDGDTASWARFGELVAAGAAGSRAACPSCAIAIHTDLGNHLVTEGVDWVIEWHRLLLANLPAPPPGKAAFEMIGLSMYPRWDGGRTAESIAALKKLAAAFGETVIYIAETAYPADGSVHPEQYPASPAGQASYLAMLRSGLSVIPAKQRGGFLWWEGSETGWQSLFNASFEPRPALRHGFGPAPPDLFGSQRG